MGITGMMSDMDDESSVIADWPMMRDPETGEERCVTQADWDAAQQALQAFTLKREMMKLTEDDEAHAARGIWHFQLALWPNPVRPGECFIAEAKAVPPEPIGEYQGRPLYAPVPPTPYVIPSNIPMDFAIELVRRWNRPQGPSSI